MDLPDTTTDIIALIKFKTSVHRGLVLLAEAVCCAVFDSYESELHQEVRPSRLSETFWSKRLNRSNSLKDFYQSLKTLAISSVVFRSLRILRKCQRIGLWRVNQRSGRNYYVFRISSCYFHIPSEHASRFKLDEDPTVFVKGEALDTRHPYPCTPSARKEDDGKGVGVLIFKTIGSEKVEYYVSNSGKD